MQVAFTQVNGRLFLPLPSGALRPGDGHPRNEQLEVIKKVGAAGGIWFDGG